MITCDSVITCDGVIDVAAKFYNDTSETAPINFNVEKSTYNKMDYYCYYYYYYYYYQYYYYYYYILHSLLLVVILLLIIFAVCCYCINQRSKHIPPQYFY